jgi:hypothetical protein
MVKMSFSSVKFVEFLSQLMKAIQGVLARRVGHLTDASARKFGRHTGVVVDDIVLLYTN